MSARALKSFLTSFSVLVAVAATVAPAIASDAAKAAKNPSSATSSQSKPKKQASASASKKPASTAKKTTANTAKKAAVKQAKAKPAARKKATAQSKSKNSSTAVAKKSPSKSGQAARIAAPAAAGAAAVMTVGESAGLHRTPDPLSLKSSVAFVVDQTTSEVLFEKNATYALPIASLTKLMTALVVIEARLDLNEVLDVTADDIDRLKNSGSRLRVGSTMTRGEMMHLALMSSENRAASALARHFPGGTEAFVAQMNAAARSLGMRDTRFVDSTGLSSENVASAQDLAKLAVAAYKHREIREYSTYGQHDVRVGRQQLHYINSNRLVRSPDWEIGLQKTGYISEAGRCLILQARVDGKPVVMVFLDSRGKDSRLGDAARVRRWLESPQYQTMHESARRS